MFLVSTSMDSVLHSAVASAARFALDRWVEDVGVEGFRAMRSRPGLLAQVDQHAAEVRDTVADRRGRVSDVALAAYADGVSDTAARRGWTPARPEQWSTASWATLRLLAVCVLATRGQETGRHRA
jgi:hypothetical protein